MIGINECVIGSFWTRRDELVRDLLDMNYEVLEQTDEYIVVEDEADDREFVLYLGHANRTMWVETIRVF